LLNQEPQKNPNPKLQHRERDCHLLFCNRYTSPSLLYLEKRRKAIKCQARKRMEFLLYPPNFKKITLNNMGVKGAKPGSPGYVRDGWKNAVERAKEIYYRDTGKTPKKKEKKPSIIKDD